MDDTDDADDRWLQAARAAFPGWDIRKLYGNYFAVPKGTPLLPSTEVDDLVEKIRRELIMVGPPGARPRVTQGNSEASTPKGEPARARS